jgi:hypothetical protein
MPRLLLASAALLMVFAVPARADRPLTNDERMQLVSALSAHGCTGGKLEFDDGKFEVDDATCSDGKIYDLHFDTAFKLIKKKLDD